MNTKSKQEARIKRAGKTRHHIRRMGVNRLTVFRSANHIYAQVFSPCGSRVLISASTLDKELASEIKKHAGNIAAATLTGKLLAARCKKAGIAKVAFDRAGYRYHGRVKALADAAREGGVEF